MQCPAGGRAVVSGVAHGAIAGNGCDRARAYQPDHIVPSVQNVEVARGAFYARGRLVHRRVDCRSFVPAVTRRARTRDCRYDSGGSRHFPDTVVACVRYKKITRAVDSHAARGVQGCASCQPVIPAVALGVVPGDGRYGSRGIDFTNDVIAFIRNENIACTVCCDANWRLKLCFGCGTVVAAITGRTIARERRNSAGAQGYLTDAVVRWIRNIEIAPVTDGQGVRAVQFCAGSRAAVSAVACSAIPCNSVDHGDAGDSLGSPK